MTTIDEIVTTAERRQHSIVSPSCLQRRSLCAGSAAMEESLADVREEPSEAAARGTRIHAMVEMLANGKTLPEDAAAEEVEVARQFVDFLDGEKAKNPAKYVYEQRVCYSDFTGELYYGYVDCLAVADDICTVYDWKTGYVPVIEAAKNLQGAAYALAVLQEFKRPCRKIPCRVVFYAPCAGQMTEHTFTDAQGLASTITNIIAACRKPNAPRTCSEEACRGCKGARFGVCPEYMAQQRSCASLQQLLPDAPSVRWSDEVLAEVYRRCKLVDALESACENELKRRIAEQGECAGYTIKEQSGGREVVDIAGLYTDLRDTITQEQFLACCKVSSTALEKAWLKAVDGQFATAKDAKAALKDTIAPHAVDKPSRRILTLAK